MRCLLRMLKGCLPMLAPTTPLRPFIINVHPGMPLCSIPYSNLFHFFFSLNPHYSDYGRLFAGWNPIFKAKFIQVSNQLTKFSSNGFHIFGTLFWSMSACGSCHTYGSRWFFFLFYEVHIMGGIPYVENHSATMANGHSTKSNHWTTISAIIIVGKQL